MIKNIEKLREWLDEELGTGEYELDAYLEDIKQQIRINGKEGFTDCEIIGKDGKAHLIYMTVEHIANEDDTFDMNIEF